MVSTLWLIPLCVVVVAGWPLFAWTRRLKAELVAFRESVRALGELRPAYVLVEDEITAIRRNLENPSKIKPKTLKLT